ncbi:class I SAM-dependent methyltransferase [Pararcticibacter amylolyticus]|uniref:SAM-dependent methyltransferase n=1 Tax=Pararcticibacter amylolyticus TaxID=2173175 RepID=A0A2U2PC07_9SPHI|nr:class I SAM-dependent methyltransferase [Pararcticibacter amylolyticus]PWG78895.1 SAM-dependent methyltransferase [Pararcticibacter amylolyticus]
MHCRFCQSELKDVFIDLVNSPAANSFLSEEQLEEPEEFYPLKVYTCSKCFLVQIAEYKKHDTIFDDQYVYFSSYSKSWLKHAEAYSRKMLSRFGFHSGSQIIEIASNDGYLLQYFKEQDIPVLGIEPTTNTAEVARSKGIETITEFFGRSLAGKLAEEGRKADLLIGNNVLAHVPDIVDFVAGMKLILKQSGVITMEFPHIVQLIENNQFDTIYHEHFSYLSFFTVKRIFESQGLELFDVEEIPTHGGSLRIYAKHKEDLSKEIAPAVNQLLAKEIYKGIDSLAYYSGFQQRVQKVKFELNTFIINAKLSGKKVAGYGAAAKGNTLLNYCGIKADLVDFVVDANPYKQNKWLPASHIPVVGEDVLESEKPDYVIILPWNLKSEIVDQLSYVRSWGGKFVTAIPVLQILGEVISTVL